MKHRAVVIRRVVLTTGRQPLEAPMLDGGTTTDAEGRQYGSLVLRVWPGSRSSLVLVVGWRDRPAPWPARWRPRFLVRRWQVGRATQRWEAAGCPEIPDAVNRCSSAVTDG